MDIWLKKIAPRKRKTGDFNFPGFGRDRGEWVFSPGNPGNIIKILLGLTIESAYITANP